MGAVELIVLAIGLAMDAFSVSICGSMALAPENRLSTAVKFGLLFGFFQFIMPVIGYYSSFWAYDLISTYDHWIAFILLMYIGVNMIKESSEGCEASSSYSVKRMFTLAIATSIDALAVGISFACLNVNIWLSSIIIGIVTFGFSLLGGIAGFKLGEQFRSKAGMIGGCVLCFLGIKILVEHLGHI